MKRNIVQWVERFFYAPSSLHRLVSYFLYPLSLLYCLIVWLRYKRAKPIDFNIPVISIGNLTVGGSGKTPLVVALASSFEKPAIILRGYGRQSSGMIVVSDGNEILCSVEHSGDEAMIYAHKVSRAIVIVSENRDTAIEQAKILGSHVIFLDDAYSKHHIKKYDIIINVPTNNTFCLPSGPFRERLWHGKKVYMAYEERTFTRRVSYSNLTSSMVLVTAIARPERLHRFLPQNVTDTFYFPDHHYFSKKELEDILYHSGATSLLVTYKDYVKMSDFELPLSLINLDLHVNDELLEAVHSYVASNAKYVLGV